MKEMELRKFVEDMKEKNEELKEFLENITIRNDDIEEVIADIKIGMKEQNTSLDKLSKKLNLND